MQSIYQHYRPEEQEFIQRVFDWIQQVEMQYLPYLTDFLTPREAQIIKQVVASREDCHTQIWGGYPGAERQRAIIYPNYYEPRIEDFELSVLSIEYPSKFGELSHSQILGTVLGTGIQRERVGDIITDGDTWQLIIEAPLTSYVIQQVDKIGRLGVTLVEIDVDHIVKNQDQWVERTVITSSLRLDTIIGKVYNLSRQKTKDLVQQHAVKVNFVLIDQANLQLADQDIVSVRRHGRFQIISQDGITKRDNLRLTIKVLQR